VDFAGKSPKALVCSLYLNEVNPLGCIVNRCKCCLEIALHIGSLQEAAMNSIALFLWTVALTGQVGADATSLGVKFGWKPESDGSLSYIAQVTPQIASQMATGGQEIVLDIPSYLQGRVNKVIWRIGSNDVEREPSEAQLMAAPRSMLPNAFSPRKLTNLNENSGQTVMIDPQRNSPPTLPTGGRLGDSIPSLASVPSLDLAQNYQTPNSRTGFNSQFDMPSTTAPGSFSASNTGFGNNSVLPRQDTMSTNSGVVYGPTLPPGYNYTGGQVTVTGTSVNPGTTNGFDSRRGSNSNTYGSNSSFSNDNFGNPNNYNSGNLGQSGSYSTPSSTNFSNSNQSGFPNASSTPYSNPNSYPNSQTQQGNTNATNFNYGLQGPDARYASNQNAYSPPPSMIPYNGNSNNGYPTVGNPNTNYGGVLPNQMATNQVVPAPMFQNQPPLLLGNNSMAGGVSTPSVVDPNRRTSSRSDFDERNYPLQTNGSSNYLVPLLFLVSLVGNVYLVMLLNQLLQRYRNLLASTRSTSLAL